MIEISGNNHTYLVNIHCHRHKAKKIKNGFPENNGYISIYAKDYQKLKNNAQLHWGKITGLSATGESVEALPVAVSNKSVKEKSEGWLRTRPVLTYQFYTDSEASANIHLFTLPTHPINDNFGMRYGVSVDDAPVSVLDFKTVGRSDEWKQAVLSNTIERSIKTPVLRAGQHALKIYLIDPGVILDRILIDLGGLKPFYGLIPETKFDKL